MIIGWYWKNKWFNVKKLKVEKTFNFGDDLNPILVKHFLNEKVEMYAKTDISKKDINFIAIGSIIDKFITNKKKVETGELYIWGSGFLFGNKKNKNEFFMKKAIPLALRGKFTKERIEKINNTKYENIVLGDPGLLIPIIFPEPVEKKYDFCIIPHGTDKKEKIIHSLLKDKNAILIDVSNTNINKTINEIKMCKFVFSSALHGLVISDSYNIPNVWTKFGNRVHGGDYKFFDYYSAFDLENDISSFQINDENKDLNKKMNEFKYLVSTEKVKEIQNKLLSALDLLK